MLLKCERTIKYFLLSDIS